MSIEQKNKLLKTIEDSLANIRHSQNEKAKYRDFESRHPWECQITKEYKNLDRATQELADLGYGDVWTNGLAGDYLDGK